MSKKDFPPSFFSLATEVLASFLVSMGLMWGIGKYLNLSIGVRVILGAILSGMVNFLMIYKIIKKK